MKVVVHASPRMKEEMTAQANPQNEVTWINDPVQFGDHADADALIDLDFENSDERVRLLNLDGQTPVLVNFIEGDLRELPPQFARINGWPIFLKRAIAEISCSNNNIKNRLEAAMQLFGKNITWVPDKPGFVSARVVSMIINEAYLALDEGVSSRGDIDTAMKLGTNYPFGPFEWAIEIGTKNVYRLLLKLSEGNPAYLPAASLEKEQEN